MSLSIYGEDGKQITDDNPLVTEHDGEQGG